MLPDLGPQIKIASNPEGWKIGLAILIPGGLVLVWALTGSQPQTHLDVLVRLIALWLGVSFTISGSYMFVGSLLTRRLLRKKKKK